MPLRRSLRCAKASTLKETENPEPEMENFSSPGPHPLLIPNIASEIFGYLSHSKLENCRLVCQTWRSVTSKHFEKKTQIVFDSEERLTEFLDYYTVENPPIFKSYKFTSNIGVQSSGFKMFLDRFGLSHVRCIHFDRFNFMVDNESHMFDIFKSVRDMEELVLDCRNCSLGQETVTVETYYLQNKLKVLRCVFNDGLVAPQNEAEVTAQIKTLTTLCLISPKLERVSSMLNSDKRKRRNYPLLNFLRPPQNLLMPGAARMEYSFNTDLIIGVTLVGLFNNVTLNLSLLEKFVHFESFVPLSCLLQEGMITKHFPLKTLNLCIMNMGGSAEQNQEVLIGMKTLLSHASPTLETFKASFGRGSDEFGMAEMGHYNFPALKNLAIHGNTQTSHLNYINGCPNLETLHVVQALLPSNFQEFTITPPLAKLRSFIGHDINMEGRRSCENILVAKIALEFPHLRRLKLDHVKDTSFRVICKELKLLEELFVQNSQVTDSGVTGISKSVLAKFTSKSKSGVNQPVFKKRLPYIGDLKNLRNIEIGSTGITDLSILYGILDCAAVRRLTIYSPKMTGKGLRCIVDKMELISLRTVCCFAIRERDLEYARSQLGDPENVILNEEKGPKNSTEVGEVIESYCVAHLEMPRK